VWNYGLLDGTHIEWNKYIINGIIDATVWLTVIILVIIKYPKIKKYISTACIFIIVIQLAALFVVMLKAPDQPSSKYFSINSDDKFTFSKEKNVIVLVLDTFQTDIFQEIINENEQYFDVFDGFTYFRNSLACFPKTYPSIAAILTGQYYDNTIPMQKFIEKNFLNNSIPQLLKSNGYQVDMFPNPEKTILVSDKVMSNVDYLRKNYTLSDLADLYDITLFRFVPHFLKKYVYNDQEWFLKKMTKDFEPVVLNNNENVRNMNSSSIFSNEVIKLSYDVNFIDQMLSFSKINDTKKVFKFYHLNGAHKPFIVNEKFEYENMIINRNNYKISAKVSLEIVKMFLNKLKELGVYDNSLIIIIGDHGAGDYEIGLNLDLLKDNNVLDKKQDKELQIVKNAGLPLVMVKRFDSKGRMNISDGPVSLSDIPKTIAAELKLENSFPGESIFKIKEDDNRERRFLYYDFDGWDKDFLLSMKEYVVSGFSWYDKSWKETGRVFHPRNIQFTGIPEVYDGFLISFGNGGNYLQYAKEGWNWGEMGFTWTDGNKASLIIPITSNLNDYDLVLYAEICPNDQDGKIKNQRVNVLINKKIKGEWLVNKLQEYELFIPKNEINKEFNIIFELPDAVKVEDGRKLGVAFKSLRIVPYYAYGRKITFDQLGNAVYYKTEGWSNPEENFTWTFGNSSSLKIPIINNSKDIRLELTAFPFLGGDKIKKQDVKITVNNVNIGQMTFEGNISRTKFINIPNRILNKSIMDITFEFPNAIVPIDLEVNEDSRPLALAFQEVVITELVPYRFGELIEFGKQGNAEDYQSEGWHFPEDGFTWSSSKAELSIPILNIDSDIVLKAIIKNCLLQDGRVNILLDGKKIGEWIMDRGIKQERTITITKDLITGSLLDITFEIPDAMSPKEMGLNNDERILGIAVESIVISEKE